MDGFPDKMSPVADVYLVLMPYGAVERPALGLSILKAVLADIDIEAKIVYANLLFAQEVGLYQYDIISHSPSYSLAGEWTFSEAAFPNFTPDHKAYFRHVDNSLGAVIPLMRRFGVTGRISDLLWSVRRRATGFVDRMARKIVSAKPKIVGCSSTFQQQCASLALLRRVKELDPAITTVIGGSNCEGPMGLATHEECWWIDYVVSGDGEEVFRKLCTQVLHPNSSHLGNGNGVLKVLNHEPTTSEGLIGPEHRTANYVTFRQRAPRAKLENMDQSPIPDYEEYFASLQASQLADHVRPGLLMETSRGCWWGAVSHCTFCGLNGGNMNFRAKSPERVLHEFAYLSERWKTKSFEIVDNILDMSYLKTVLPALTEQGGYNIFYETKANLKRSQVHEMAEAGIKWLQPGIESLDDGILRAIAKGTTARQNVQMLKWSRSYGIYVFWLLLYNVPGDSDEVYLRMAEWLPSVFHLQPPASMEYVQFHRFSPYQMRPADFNLNISPERSYSFVYPWKQQSVANYAYFWDDYNLQRERIYWFGDMPRNPGLRKLHQVINEWNTIWAGQRDRSTPPCLALSLKEENILITDTRPCRVQDSFVLEGMAAQIYQVCDQSHNANGIVRELSSSAGGEITWATVEPIVRRLCAQKLMLDFDGWFLSLASAETSPPPDFVHYPGGRVYSASEVSLAM